MATRELKPEQILTILSAAAATTVSDAYALRHSNAGQFPKNLEAQVIPEAGNTAFSVTIEHSNDPNRGWQVVATITTAAPVQIAVCGGYYRATAGTATGGPVTVLMTAS